MPRSPEPHWWWGGLAPWESPRPMSMVQLIEARSMDLRLASVLWQLMERRTSLVVASMPRLAGKTTVLTALLDLLAPNVDPVFLHGSMERWDFLKRTAPTTTYLLAAEISDHLPVYLWGKNVQRLFKMAEEGYGFAGAMHADSPDQVFQQLTGEHGVPRESLGRLRAVLTLYCDHTHYPNSVRRSQALDLISASDDGRPALTRVAEWRDGGFAHVPTEKLAAALGGQPDALTKDLEARANAIQGLLEQGHRSRENVSNPPK